MALNPALIRAVEMTIGRVHLIRVNEPLTGYYYDDPQTRNRRLKIVRRGEELVTNCPFCNDDRGRLLINHRYGIPDPEVGNRGTNLWKCFNEECQHDPDHRAELRDRLLPELDLPRGGPKFRQPEIIRSSPTELEPVEFNGVLLPVTDLPPDHKAVRYLIDRGFDVEEVGRLWDLGYADSIPARTRGSMAQDRLIVPVHQNKVMIGWQARFIGEIDFKTSGVPKYLTYFPKSLALYGMDQVGDEPVLVLMEGASDVWRYGPGGVCGFGKTLSHDQARILADLAKGRPIILVPDANDPGAFDKFCDGMKLVLAAGHCGPYGLAPLPRGKDPATMSRTALRNLIRCAASIAVEQHRQTPTPTQYPALRIATKPDVA